MGMSKEEFMARYKADIKKKANERRDKEYDYQDYVVNVHLRRNKKRRL